MSMSIAKEVLSPPTRRYSYHFTRLYQEMDLVPSPVIVPATTEGQIRDMATDFVLAIILPSVKTLL
jgi:hypothetical protein